MLTIWFTGLSGSGKTTIGRECKRITEAQGHKVELLDGDEYREGLCRDLGFSKRDRDENIHRLSFVSNILNRNGIVSIVTAISPYNEAREKAKKLLGDNMVLVYCSCPLDILKDRDTKGLYRKALAGEITNLTGVGDPYEPPMFPDIVCNTDKEEIKESIDKVIMGVIDRWE